MHRLNHRRCVFRWDIRGDAVAEVEDVAVAVAVVGEHAAHFVFDNGGLGAQNGRVEVALQRDVIAKDGAGGP